MNPQKPSPDKPALEGPDYVTLVIEWDALADDIERGTTGASPRDMPTKDSDWVIDEASKDSFPASDPPAWGSSRAAADPPDAEFDDQDQLKAKRRRRMRTPVIVGVIGLFTLTGILAGIKWMRDR
jgi:hypothetical protein